MPYAYQTIINDFLRRIRSGELRPGVKLPALDALEKTYPQSRMTLYRALRHLTELGYLNMTPGRGTFVRPIQPRQRIGILTGPNVFDHGVVPFAFHVFRHAHARFARHGMDAQLYTEDPSDPTTLPAGLREDLDRGRLAGLLSVAGQFPWVYACTPTWKRHAVPHVNIGTGAETWNVDIDRDAFLDMALHIARRRGRRRVALLENATHLQAHLEHFHKQCRREHLTPCPPLAAMPDPGLSFEEFGYELMRRVWKTTPRPEVVIVPDDVITKGVTQAAATLGIHSPRQLLIVAMVNRGAQFFYPVPVVPVEVNVEGLVATAVQMLFTQMKGKRTKPHRVVHPPVMPDPETNGQAAKRRTGNRPRPRSLSH